jgi:hypothetical protein
MNTTTVATVAAAHAHGAPRNHAGLRAGLAARATALGLSTLVTLLMLGSMDFLATSDVSPSSVMASASRPQG